MKKYQIPDSVRCGGMSAPELRESYVIDSLAARGEIRLAWVDADRAVVGWAIPETQLLALTADPDLRAAYFLERRELGALNIGGPGQIRADGKAWDVQPLDCLYLGRGTKQVGFISVDAASPAEFYLLSYPAHCEHPAVLVRSGEATGLEIGSRENANRRKVCRYIHQEGARSCQLVMGVTHLAEGSVWNTMPPHTHLRRSEIYMYFNLGDNNRIFHLMGTPENTRHLVLSNRDAVVSPGWSIHAGAGTHAYSFCWGMGGENQDYADMDVVGIGDLR
jgi:4-deoxy-L-threo-5-hexosulose-uronate ketol-isomerase